MTAFICLCTGAFWLSTHINLNLYLTLHRMAFLRKHPLAPHQNRRLPWEAFLEFQAALKFPVTFFLYFHFQQGEELMIHLLPVTFWITGLRCTRATLRGRAYLLVLSQFGLNIYSLLLGLHAWTPEGSKTFIASPAPVFGVRCSQLSPSPIPSFYITRETRLLAGDAPVLPESLLSSLFDFIKTKRWILTRTHLLTTHGLPSPKWRFDGGRPNKVAHGIFYFSWSRGRLLPLLTFLFLIALQNSFWWSACLYVSL